jgi:hypothetical protein
VRHAVPLQRSAGKPDFFLLGKALVIRSIRIGDESDTRDSTDGLDKWLASEYD